MCGVGLWQEAIVMAVLIVLVHVLLRPMGTFVNKISFHTESDSAEVCYEVIVGCKEQVENHVRMLVLENLKDHKDLQLKSLKSTDNGNPAFSYLKFEMFGIGNKDEVLEKITSKVSLEYGVSEVTWERKSY
jgi:putative Mg2+ transporter-C (MgtC) family protein